MSSGTSDDCGSTRQQNIPQIRLGFTLLTSARTNQDALSMLLSYCSTVCQYVECEDISTVTWALTSKELNLIGSVPPHRFGTHAHG
jgi:hypothetical protein